MKWKVKKSKHTKKKTPLKVEAGTIIFVSMSFRVHDHCLMNEIVLYNGCDDVRTITKLEQAAEG